jgi:hypothetical protein
MFKFSFVEFYVVLQFSNFFFLILCGEVCAHSGIYFRVTDFSFFISPSVYLQNISRILFLVVRHATY